MRHLVDDGAALLGGAGEDEAGYSTPPPKRLVITRSVSPYG
ncbi:hypothetical protein [Streptomyces pactum]